MELSKKWALTTLFLAFFMLIGAAGITVIVDPYFHYHKPLSWLEYPLNN